VNSSDRLYVTGGARLEGSVSLSGSKNGALPLLAATLLAEGECILYQVPLIEDVLTMAELLRALGLRVDLHQNGTAVIRNHGIKTCVAPEDIVKRMRASFWVAGPLLARLGRAEVPLPGGCQLGSRPVGYIIDAFRPLGVHAEVEHGYMMASAPQGLIGGTIYLDARYRSPGATFNALMAATMARGETVIENACSEPEVVDFCQFLNEMGARVSGLGSSTLHVQGVTKLVGCAHRTLPDRLEAGTFLLAGAITHGDVTTRGIDPDHLDFFLGKLEETGAEVARESDAIRVRGPARPRAAEVTTEPYPMFPTDLQPPMGAYLCLADGTSVVTETIYDGRLTYFDELGRMGAQAELRGQTAIVRGVPRLTAASVQAQNIRAGAAMVIAALAAEGVSQVNGRHFILRGYQEFEQKLTGLGAQISLSGATQAATESEHAGQRPRPGD